MAAACPQCGESLIGAVNRCWKCGCSFQQPYLRADDKQPAEAVSPPPSAPAEAPVLATLAKDAPQLPAPRRVGLEGFAAPLSPAQAPSVPAPATTWLGPSPGEPKLVSREVVRRGSPFDPRCVPTPPARGVGVIRASLAPARQGAETGLATPHAALGGVWSSLVLGVFGLLLSFWRFEGALVALVGLGMGIWGLQSQRRNWAFVALLICTLALMLGVYTGVLTLDRELKRMYGQSAGFLAP